MRGILSFAFCVFLFLQGINAQPVILYLSQTAYPGEVFTLMGDGFGLTPQIWCTSLNNNNNKTQLQVVTQFENSLTSVIPTTFIMDVYEIWVSDGTTMSTESVKMNQALGQHYDMMHVNSGATFRIFGKNLYFPGSSLTPTVTFFPLTTSGAMLTATVDTSNSDQFTLTAKAPTLQDGVTYNVQIDNGYNSPSFVDDTILGRNGTDVFGIGMGWAVDFVNFTNNVITLSPNTSTTNVSSISDDNRFYGALYTLGKTGGGILKLAAGHYYLRTCGAQIGNNFMLQGAGVDQTFIHFGSCPPSGGSYTQLFYSFGIDLFGMMDLTWQQEGTTILLTMHNMHGCSRQAIMRVNFNFLYTQSQGFACTNLFMEDVSISSVTNYENSNTFIFGGYSWGCAVNAILRRVSTYWETSAMAMDASLYFVVEDSSFVRNQTLQSKFPANITNFRGLTFNFAQKVAFLNNHVETLNPDPYTSNALTNDGETLNVEGGGPKPGWGDVGNVTSATALTVTDANNNFTGPIVLSPVHNIVHIAIISGPGTGQIRKVLSTTARAVTIDRPWKVIPTSASRYTILNVMNTWLVKGNNFTGFAKGAPELYLGRAANVTVVSNSYHNNGGPYINPHTRTVANPSVNDCDTGGVFGPYDKVSYFFGIGYNIQFLRNTMFANNPQHYMQLGVFNSGPYLPGVMLQGIEIKHNDMTRVGNDTYNNDAMYLSYCASGPQLFSGIAQNNSFSSKGFQVAGNSAFGTVIACTNTKNLVGNLIWGNCGSMNNTNSTITSDLCPSSNFLWSKIQSPTLSPSQPPSHHSSSPSLSVSLLSLLFIGVVFIWM